MMKKQNFKVQGMSCSHCAQIIQDKLSTMDGVQHLDIQLENKSITIEHQGNLTLDDFNQQLRDTHYELAQV